MENEWDQVAPDWDEDPYARAYAKAAFGSLTSVLVQSDVNMAQARVLDFGCGTGLLTELLVGAGASVHAVDTSTGMLDVLKRKAAERGWNSVTMASELSAEESPVDMIVCSSVCAFVDDYPALVQELTSHLTRGGFFIQWDWERSGGAAAEDDRGLAREQIAVALKAAGLEDVEVAVAFTIDIEGQSMAPLIGHGRRL